MKNCTRCGSTLDRQRYNRGLLACPKCDVMREVVECPACQGTSQVETGTYAGLRTWRKCTCVAGLVAV